MPRKPKAVPLSKIEDIQSSLKQKAATPKTISLEELVLTLAQPIQDMLDAGYSYEDVAEVFQGHGVELAASGIKSFHKKARASTAVNNSNDSANTSDSESDFTADLTSDSSVSDDGNSPVESDALSTESAVEPSDLSKPNSTRGKKAAKAHEQFNITDRSDL